ncbi:MAG: response regulator [Proteobacteria bacterium]|nr:response regulator [Pseudomonadota bacterium]
MTDSSKIKVLVLDDEVSIRESIKQFLSDFDFDVMTAETGEDALKRVYENTFDVAIVDMRLPEMSGDMFILKAHEIKKELKYLIMTGSVDFQIHPDLVRIGITAEQILQKPLTSLFQLIKSIEAVL